MEAIAIITLATLALLVWKLMEANEKIEHVDARLSNIDTVLAAYYKMLKDLQPKEPVEIPTRLTVEQLRTIFKDEFLFPEPNEALKKGAGEYKRKVLTENEKNVLKNLYGTKDVNNDLDKVYHGVIQDEEDNQYGNEGSTFSLYEDEQLKKIRKHVQERKKQSLNK